MLFIIVQSFCSQWNKHARTRIRLRLITRKSFSSLSPMAHSKLLILSSYHLQCIIIGNFLQALRRIRHSPRVSPTPRQCMSVCELARNESLGMWWRRRSSLCQNTTADRQTNDNDECHPNDIHFNLSSWWCRKTVITFSTFFYGLLVHLHAFFHVDTFSMWRVVAGHRRHCRRCRRRSTDNELKRL